MPLYGYFGTKVVRIRLISGLLLVFASTSRCFTRRDRRRREGVVFYIWVGIFNVLGISQIWAFANDIYTEGQGNRLFPVIGIGSSLGACSAPKAPSSSSSVRHDALSAPD